MLVKTEELVKVTTAFRTINEISSELDVPQHVLRFWETKFPQLHPLKRSGGRRYYRSDDVELLRRIQRLLYNESLTITAVQRLLAETHNALASPSSDDSHEEALSDLGLFADEAEESDDTHPTLPPVGLPDAMRRTITEVVGELRSLHALLLREI